MYMQTFPLLCTPQVAVALEAWRVLMPGRFRLLNDWVEFVLSRQHVVRMLTEDQWRQVGWLANAASNGSNICYRSLFSCIMSMCQILDGLNRLLHLMAACTLIFTGLTWLGNHGCAMSQQDMHGGHGCHSYHSSTSLRSWTSHALFTRTCPTLTPTAPGHVYWTSLWSTCAAREHLLEQHQHSWQPGMRELSQFMQGVRKSLPCSLLMRVCSTWLWSETTHRLCNSPSRSSSCIEWLCAYGPCPSCGLVMHECPAGRRAWRETL